MTLANLVGNGLPLLKALELCAGAARNSIVRSHISDLAVSVAEGAALSRSMKRCSYWPPLLIDMVRVGEETGQLASSLERAGTRFERDLAEKTGPPDRADSTDHHFCHGLLGRLDGIRAGIGNLRHDRCLAAGLRCPGPMYPSRGLAPKEKRSGHRPSNPVKSVPRFFAFTPNKAKP